MNVVIDFGLIVRWLLRLMIRVHFPFFWGFIEGRVIVVMRLWRLRMRIVRDEGRMWVVGIHGRRVVHLHGHHWFHIIVHVIVVIVLFASLVGVLE
jgi:hypothetical protein